MVLRKITLGILIILLTACDVSGSDFTNDVNDEKKSSNHMLNAENRLSYLDAKKLSIGFLGADLTDEIKQNLLMLENKSKQSNEINAQYILALISFYDGDDKKKDEAIKVFYRLAEVGHPYAALEFYKYAKSDLNNFNAVKKIINLSSNQLNFRLNNFIKMAIGHNINAAYYYYSEYLMDNNVVKKNSINNEIDDFKFSSLVVEHVFLNTSSYLGDVADLDVFLIFANLLLNSTLDHNDIVKAKALVAYFDEKNKFYAEEFGNPSYKELSLVISKIRNKYSMGKIDVDIINAYIDKINSNDKLLISDWIESEIDYL
ncbi:MULTISPECIES: hypothetical protein [unclassified Acinetobacter]|uniref:hypothetical protein n=1 Tax=unclassified Acinetobacter TaxID=196816 RepID=UPI0015D2590C|nr:MULTISPECIES: hypothetical protein [unclassified Acinetobacter]